MLTGYSAPFHQQPIHIRESIVERWRLSYLPPLNVLYKQMTSIGKSIWLKTSPTFARIAGVPPVPNQYRPGPEFKYDFIQFPEGSEPAIYETDVVIVGSGCGGAVCAKNLAEAGHRVLVVEKSYYYPPSQLPMNEDASWLHLFENGGVEATDDGSLSVVSGSSWGGGGTINWSASLQVQSYVRKEWAVDRGLTFFETAEFQNCLDRVCNRMGVSADHIRHNHANSALLEGSRKLGYHAKAVPQNTGGNEHYCGHCSVGCGSATKQGPAVTWLPDAARAGAKFAEGFNVDRVLFEGTGRKVAIGVKGTWTSRDSHGGVNGPASDRTVRDVIIKAKKVIVSCGTLWSPVILMNSGLEVSNLPMHTENLLTIQNPQIGRNLYLHPVNSVAAVYKEDVRPWEGKSMP
jgi:choline dehydrogenase-like flavoprotein